MAVDNQRNRDEDGVIDRFPVGMRVLAVDDNPTCLKVLDKLLRQCKYHVTTTTNAIDALRMLRENRSNFDLVISDVDMPDMDGFKLLELVGLEMDLPVIMLSGHSDTNMVFKGVTHGACDYLLKPVRLEELKNIWQHVVRKKKIKSKDQNNSSNDDRNHNISGGNSQNILENSDQNKKLGKRRKDKDEDEEEDEEEGDGEGTGDEDDPSSQKKPRVVWSVDLHKKFVSAVNQLGLEKAVPKKILDLMNIEGLTRENVASHLQKYRLYLKKANHQANIVAAFGSTDSYLRMSGIEGYADFCTPSGSGRMSNTTLPSYASSGIFGRLNSPAGLNMRGINSSTLIRPVQSQNINSSLNKLGNIQPSSMFPANQSSNLLHNIPSELNRVPGLSQLTQIDSTGFAAASGFHNSRATNSSLQVSNHQLILQGNSQQTHNVGSFRNQNSVGSASLENPNIVGIGGSSNLLDYHQSNENWQSENQLPKFSANSLPVCESFNNNQLPASSISAFNARARVGNSPVDFSTGNATIVDLEDARNVLRGKDVGFIGNVMQPSSFAPHQRWEEHKPDYSQNTNRPFNSVNTQVCSSRAVTNFVAHNINQSKTVCSNRVDASFVGQVNDSASTSLPQCNEVEKFSSDVRGTSNDGYMLDMMKSQVGYIEGFGTLDDIMGAIVKREQNEMTLMDGEMGFDVYPVGSCI